MRNSWLQQLRRRISAADRRAEALYSRPILSRLEDRTVPTVATFQQGVGGYTGTQDAEIFSVEPTTVQAGGTDTAISVDNQDGGGVRQGLVRFDNIFGTGAGQIPLGSLINSATLTLIATDQTAAGAELGPYRMLVTWSQTTATWSTFPPIGGVQTDGTDAVPLIESFLTPETGTGARNFTVTQAVRAWANGASNFGWVLINKQTDGWDFATSENGTTANRPLLTVDYTAPSGPGTFQFSDPAFSVVEKTTTTSITVNRVGGSTGAVSVNFAAAAGTAGGADFTATSGTLNFAAGEISKTFPVNILDDTALEGPETINLTLSSPTGGATIGTATATLTILDQDVLLNEVNVSPPNGNGFEYVELIGSPGIALANVYFVAFEGDFSGTELGIADMVTPLTSSAVGTSGLVVIKAATGGYTIPGGVTVVTDSQLNGNGLEGGSITLALIQSATAITETTDYDTNDDGVLDLPAGAQILDAVGWTDNGGSDKVFGPRLLQTNPTPQAATRVLNDDTPQRQAGWYNGTMRGDNPLIYLVPPDASPNLPAEAHLSPGLVNRNGYYSYNGFLQRYGVAENGGSVTITVSRLTNIDSAESVSWATSNGTATAGSDYTAGSGVLNFAVGQVNATIVVNVLNDSAIEGPETIFVTLSNPTGSTIPFQAVATVTIDDDDDVSPTFQEGANSYAGTQDTYVWAGSPGLGQDSPFQYGVDFDEGNLPLWGLLRFDNFIGTGAGQIPPGSKIFDASLRMFINDVSDLTANVTFHRMLAPWEEDATWNGLVDGIYRDDVEARVAADGRVVSPGIAGLTFVEGAGMTKSVQDWVDGATNLGWAIFSDSGNGIDFAPSEATTAANRPVLVVSYAPPTGAGSLQFEDPTYAATEGAGVTINIPVVRTGGTAGSVTATYAVNGVTATAGTDYTAPATGTLTFGPGVVRQNITLTILNDTALEPNETVSLALSSPGGGATLGAQATTTLSIKNNTVDSGLRLNELLVDPSGTDNPFEYAEVIGTPGTSMANVYFVSMEGDGIAPAGLADVVVDLSAAANGGSGLTVIKASTGGFTIPTGTTVVTDPRFNSQDLFENGTNSFLLIFSPSSVISETTDFDPENDGIVNLPPGASILDAVGWTDGGANDFIHGSDLTIPTNNPPGAATRIRGNTTANSASAWYFGDMTGANNALTYSTTGVGLPAGALISPGSLNFRTGAASTPAVQAITVDTGTIQRSMVRNLTVVFDGLVTFVGPTVDAFSLVRTGTGGGAVTVTPTANPVSGVTVVTLTFSGPFIENGSLGDGNYTLTVLGSKVQNSTGLMGTDRTLNFHRLFGDVDGNKSVNGTDLNAFRAAFGTNQGDAGYQSFLDFDGNGAINGTDLGQFRSRFGVILP